MQNCYATLGVTHDVTPQIAKIAYEGKLRALAKSGLPDAEKRAEERLLATAYATLSNPAKKDWYDKQWMKHGEREERAQAALSRNGWFAAGALSLLLIGGISYYYVNRANEREKIRLEQAALDAAKEADQARLDLAKRQQDARERAYSDSLRRMDQSRAYAQESQLRNMEATAARQRAYDEQRARQQEDIDRRQAQMEVERQKRYLQQREYEEQRAAAEREARVRYEADRRAREAALEAIRARQGH